MSRKTFILFTALILGFPFTFQEVAIGRRKCQPRTTTLFYPTTDSTVTTTTSTEDSLSWVCPPWSHGKERHPYNCSLYVECDPTHPPRVMLCSGGTYFNPHSNATVCDHPERVPNCVEGTPPSPTRTTATHRVYKKRRIPLQSASFTYPYPYRLIRTKEL